jgi:hypothetical protein
MELLLVHVGQASATVTITLLRFLVLVILILRPHSFDWRLRAP